MQALLGWFETAATRAPAVAIAALLAATVGFGALASTVDIEVDLTQFGDEGSEAVQAMDRLAEEFGDPTAAVQVIIDAGPDGSVLTSRGLETIDAAQGVILDALGSDVRTEAGEPQLLSLGAVVGGALAQQGIAPGAAEDAQIGAVAAQAVAANPQLAALVSDDVDLEAGTARGTVLVALLDLDLTESERTEAAERVKAAFEGEQSAPLSDVEVTVFSTGLFGAGLLEAIQAEAPLLFGLALLVVLAILALAYRSVFDVAIGFAGLVATVVWTFGIVALLGPGFIGWAGPPSQIAIIVPVLLVGLGIDYSVHLTARYREQRAAGEEPRTAAGRALHTVGAALALATVATAAGFGASATAPLQMLADFGVFVAFGVVCAFLIMGLLVPSAQVLRDRRRADREPGEVRELGLARLMGAPVVLARRAPAAGLAVAALLVGASLLAAAGLETEFDRDDFVPVDSEIEAVLAHQTELFGGGVTESTFVLVDGDLTDPAVANAVWEAQGDLGDIEGIRRVGGTPQVLSVVTLAAAVLDPTSGMPPMGGLPQGQPEGPGPLPLAAAWTGNGFAGDADLGAVYALLRQAVGEQRLNQLLTPDAQAAVVQIRTTAGDAGAERIQREVEAAFAPVELAGATVSLTSEPIIIGEMSEDLSAFQAQAIALTLAIVLALLTAYYGLAHRRPLLGVIAMIPAVVSASLILGMMWVLGFSFNVLTATLTAIAVGIGVPYGVHVVNRFVEDLDGAPIGEAAGRTLRSTGGALAGSALTTLGAFVVLSFSDLPPIQSLGLLGGTGIAFALLAAVLVEPGALVLWARRRARRVS